MYFNYAKCAIEANSLKYDNIAAALCKLASALAAVSAVALARELTCLDKKEESAFEAASPVRSASN